MSNSGFKYWYPVSNGLGFFAFATVGDDKQLAQFQKLKKRLKVKFKCCFCIMVLLATIPQHEKPWSNRFCHLGSYHLHWQHKLFHIEVLLFLCKVSGGRSWENYTIVHFDGLKSSHAVKVWTAANQQTDLSIALFFKLKKSWWLGQKCPLFSSTHFTKTSFLKYLERLLKPW